MYLKIKDFLKAKVLASPLKAEKLSDKIKEANKKSREIVLDFTEINGATFSFLIKMFTRIKCDIFFGVVKLQNMPKTIKNQLEHLLKESNDIKEIFKKRKVILI